MIVRSKLCPVREEGDPRFLLHFPKLGDKYGFNNASTGAKVLIRGLAGLPTPKERKQEKIVALAGNPNVGKSTVFNSLTGLHQHTGNWPGKTVTNAQGKYRYKNESFLLVDIPGTYSLMANSAEEEIARDFICFGHPDAVVSSPTPPCLSGI